MQKIVKYTSLFFVFTVICFGQKVDTKKYGLDVIDDIETYMNMVQADSTKKLVNLEEIIPGIRLDIRYATDNNFLGEQVYDTAMAFLRYPAAVKLKEVQEELKEQGLELKIFDGYRPYTATVIFYENYPDTNYVASAWRGSRHNRGCAVDLTIIDSETGEEIEMPTPYDDFTEKAHHDYMDLPGKVIENRNLLKEVMTAHGFDVYSYEWWHYDFSDWKNFELMDLSFEELISENEIY